MWQLIGGCDVTRFRIKEAQEMVVALMEYVMSGFRIQRTEVQRDDWKQVAQSSCRRDDQTGSMWMR